MFRNITLSRLAAVCGISSADEALSLVSGMVSKGVVEAAIDQVRVLPATHHQTCAKKEQPGRRSIIALSLVRTVQ